MRTVWVAVIVGALASGAATTATQAADAARDEMIRRGEYVARAAGCVSCHTEPGGKAFAGGGALKTPFGTVYAPNITPDKSGIGGWEAQDFERAVRLGVRKDGALLYPAMPYASYAHMSRDDLYALWSYLRLVPAVTHSTPKNSLSFPFDNRAGLGVWQSLYYKPGAFSTQPAKGEAWNRGHYLVEALGHCDTCHTSRNIAQSADPPHRLTDAQLEDWYAPDMARDPLTSIASAKIDDVARLLRTNGPMHSAVHDSLGHLTDADMLAMATYLKDAPKGAAPERVKDVTTTSDENLKEGKAQFERSCAGCHGNSGQGRKGVRPLAGATALSARSPHYVIVVLLEGLNARGARGAMDSFAKSLDDQQIADVTNFVRTAWGNRGAPNATPWTVGSWRQLAQPAAGGRIGELACPSLDESVLQPALAEGPKLRHATHDRAELESLVSRYTRARPQSSSVQVIEALSAVYCRIIAPDNGSAAQSAAELADFSLQAAVVMTERPGGKNAGN
ncbi:MAG TPA: cytochrome c [Steroidobacteraceae bacterium]|jgi:mono/diheme cytochrome c family protein|nr:cytochrome c [Steroidobacteraceae bacterium]